MKYVNKFKKAIIQQFEEWVKLNKRIDTRRITAKDFDSWLSGYMAGLSIFREGWDIKSIKEISDSLVNSEIAKSIGVRGTLKETIEIVKIKK